jgi:hypothetical protein
MISIGFSGCASLDRLLRAAAEKQAEAKAGVNLPDLPPVCTQKMRRITPQLGEKWRGVQLRWETAADEKDALTAFCADFYRTVQTQYAGPR